MKLAFVYSMDDDSYWQDGLRRALQLLEKDWRIDYFNSHGIDKMETNKEYDFVLVWGGVISRQVLSVVRIPGKKGICFAGGFVHPTLLSRFDVVFMETNWHMEECRKKNIKANLAFGVNTDLFYPMPEQPKLFDYIYPAAFAKWKNHESFSTKPGIKLAVGYIQPDGVEKECLDVCQKNGVIVLPRVKYEVMPYLYNASKTLYIPSTLDGGGERAVLEGLACGINVEVDNPKLLELLRNQKKRLSTAEDYALALKRGIENALVN